MVAFIRQVYILYSVYSGSFAPIATALSQANRRAEEEFNALPLLLCVCLLLPAIQEEQAEMAKAVQGQTTFVCSFQSVAFAWAFLLLFPLPDSQRCAPRLLALEEYLIVKLSKNHNGEFVINFSENIKILC